jgi:hypothetical protein
MLYEPNADLQKRRKVEGGNGSDDRSSMLKLYTDVNALTSEVGEMLNTYFVDPVSKTVCSPLCRIALEYS